MIYIEYQFNEITKETQILYVEIEWCVLDGSSIHYDEIYVIFLKYS